MRAGRTFRTQDSPASRVAIVNEKLARRLFPGRNPIGAHIWINSTPYGIAGVVADYSTAMMHRPAMAVFLPLGPETPNVRRMQFVVRAVSDPVPLVAAIRGELRTLAGSNVITGLFPLDHLIAMAGQEILIGTLPMTPLLLIGMLLSAAGIYGVLAFAVERRSREMAVRIAIGAAGRDLVHLVVVHSLRLVMAGVFLGVAATYALTRVAQGEGGVFDSPHWGAFVIPVLIVAGIAALATWVPSRRAQRIDPAALLRIG
jgi:putative ABC transport system permease protein